MARLATVPKRRNLITVAFSHNFEYITMSLASCVKLFVLLETKVNDQTFLLKMKVQKNRNGFLLSIF